MTGTRVPCTPGEGLKFTYYDATITAIAPAGAPNAGGTLLTLSGVGLGDYGGPRCRVEARAIGVENSPRLCRDTESRCTHDSQRTYSRRISSANYQVNAGEARIINELSTATLGDFGEFLCRSPRLFAEDLDALNATFPLRARFSRPTRYRRIRRMTTS